MQQDILLTDLGSVYKDANDAERLSVDPTMRRLVGRWPRRELAATTSQMRPFETDVLT